MTALPTQLEISTSARSTWLWAPDTTVAQRVQELLGAACRPARRSRELLRQVLDIDIGVDALAACETLIEHGFTFTRHPTQHFLDRDKWPARLPGMT